MQDDEVSELGGCSDQQVGEGGRPMVSSFCERELPFDGAVLGDPTESTPQQLKYLWHTLLAHGHDADRGHSAAHAPERRDGDTQR